MRNIFIMDLVIMIMRACIYLLFSLYLSNLLFPQLLMKMLLTIFLKITHNVIEVMAVPHGAVTCSEWCSSYLWWRSWHSVHLLPLYWASYQIFSKKRGGRVRGLTGSQFLEGVCWERADDLFQEGLQFLRKK